MRSLALLPVPVIAALALAAAPAAAQSQGQMEAEPEPVRLTGMTLDHWRGASGALLRPTLRRTSFTGWRPGSDLALVIFPDGISVNPPGLVVGLQAGIAQPIHAGPATFLLKGGGTGLVAIGFQGGGTPLHLVPGLQVGLGLLLETDAKSTMRFDVTRHWYRSNGYWYEVLSFGIGFSAVRRRSDRSH